MSDVDPTLATKAVSGRPQPPVALQRFVVGSAVFAVKPASKKPNALAVEAVRSAASALPVSSVVDWVVAAHRGGALLAPSGSGRVLGGALTRLAEWPLRGCKPGIYTPRRDTHGARRRVLLCAIATH